jgi:hypothetical protein
MTQDEIIEMAIKAHYESKTWIDIYKDEITAGTVRGYLEAFAKLVAEKEREACAEICDGFYLSWIDIQGRYEFMGEGASECAGAIRARGQA